MRAFKLFHNKHKFYNAVLVLFAVIIAICSVLLFVSVSMHSDFIHKILIRIHPIGRNIFIISVLITIGSIYLNRIQYKTKHKKFRIPQERHTKRVFLGVAVIMVVCISLLPALICWSKADKNYYYTIGGLIPWSDAESYYTGAENLLQTGKLDSRDQRRPLNAALFAVRLGLTGNNIQYALLIQGVLFGLACFSATYVVGQIFNFSTGCIFFATAFIYAAICLPTTMNESLGITLGLLAFSLFCYGIFNKKQIAYHSGLVVLTLALLGRAGPMLVLPALMIYAGYLFGTKNGYNWRAMGIGGICIFFGFLINYCLIWVYGDGKGLFLGNFSHTLYGLSVGGKGWKQIYLDYPQTLSLPEVEGMNFIYTKALDNIRRNPFLLFKAYFLGLFIMPMMLAGHLARLVAFQNDGSSPYNLIQVIIAGIILFPFILIGLFRFWRGYRDHIIFHFILVVMLGFFLSLPIIYKDGTLRTIAVTFPFIAAIFALATIGWRRELLSTGKKEREERQEKAIGFWFPTLLVLILVILAIFGPWFFLNKPGKPQSYSKLSCPSDQQALFMRIGPGLPYLEIENTTRNSFAPSVNAKDFSILDRNEAAPLFRRIVPPATLLLAFDRETKKAQYLVAPPGFVGKQWEEMFICAQNEGSEEYKLWRLKALSH